MVAIFGLEQLPLPAPPPSSSARLNDCQPRLKSRILRSLLVLYAPSFTLRNTPLVLYS